MTTLKPVLQNGLPNQITFRNDPFDFIKDKILSLNPGVDLDWDDFIIDVVDVVGKTGNKLTLRLKDEAKPKYKNPHRTVDFTYTIDVTLAEIFRDVLGIHEVMHYDDGVWLEETHGRLSGNAILPGIYFDRLKAYKRADGTYTTESNEFNRSVFPPTFTDNEEDLNAFYLGVTTNSWISITSDNNESQDNRLITVSLIPATDGSSGTTGNIKSSRYPLVFLFRKDSEATLDFDLVGGEFNLNDLGISKTELYSVSPVTPNDESGDNGGSTPGEYLGVTIETDE